MRCSFQDLRKSARSFWAVAAHQPPQCRRFARGGQLIVVVQPILIGERLPQGVGLTCELMDRFLLLHELIESILNRLTTRAVRIV